MAKSLAAISFGLASLLLGHGAASAFETKAKQALMVEAGSGTVLYSKGADDPVAPASLAKLMSMETVFHALKAGEVTLSTVYPVSENAWRTGGAPSGTSTMFAALKSQIKLEDLMRGVIVQSANDGCIIIAEGMTGSEAKFVERMNQRARTIGLKNSTFRNSTGLPAEGQVVTVRELVDLGTHVWKTYPEFYRIYAEPEFTWNKITQRNRNPLLAMDIGADGMGTGYTEQSGYALLGSVAKGDTRLFAAMAGLASEKERTEEARKLFDWGLNGFERTEIFKADQQVGAARVYGGTKSRVALKAAGRIAMLTPVGSEDRVTAHIVYKGPLVAPIKSGTPIGALTITNGGDVVQRTPLFAAEDIEVGSLGQRAKDAISELAFGWLR